MARSNYQNYRKRKAKKQGVSTDQYQLVGSDIFLKSSIQFLNSVDDLAAQKSIIRTTPVISVIGSGSKILIDYSHSKNKIDLENILNLFDGIDADDEFVLFDAYWQIEESDSINANFNGTYYFESLEQENIIVARPKTTISVADGVYRYSSVNFEEVPQIQVSSTTSTKKISIIKNILGFQSEKSFRNLSIKHNVKDLYEIEFVGSSSNTGRIKIHNYRLASDGSEELLITDQITEEIITSDGYYIVHVYVTTKDKDKIKTISSPDSGSCDGSLFSDSCFYTSEEFCINSNGNWDNSKICGKEDNQVESVSLEAAILSTQEHLAELSILVQSFINSNRFGGFDESLFPINPRNPRPFSSPAGSRQKAHDPDIVKGSCCYKVKQPVLDLENTPSNKWICVDDKSYHDCAGQPHINYKSNLYCWKANKKCKDGVCCTNREKFYGNSCDYKPADCEKELCCDYTQR